MMVLGTLTRQGTQPVHWLETHCVDGEVLPGLCLFFDRPHHGKVLRGIGQSVSLYWSYAPCGTHIDIEGLKLPLDIHSVGQGKSMICFTPA